MPTEKKNSDVFLRPRFSIECNQPQDAILKKFQENLKSGDCLYCSKIVGEHIFIDVPKEKAHFWSPQLHIEIEEMPGDKTVVKGLFGPKPQVWTLFMFVHFILGIAFLSFAMMAYSKWSLKSNYTFALTMVIVIPIIWIFLYFLGQMGKKSSKNQMEALHDFMWNTLEKGKNN